MHIQLCRVVYSYARGLLGAEAQPDGEVFVVALMAPGVFSFNANILRKKPSAIHLHINSFHSMEVLTQKHS